MDEDIRVEETIQKTEGVAAGGAVSGVPAGAGTPVTAEIAGGAVPGVPAGAEMPVAADAAGGTVPGVPAGAEVPVTAEIAGDAVPGVPAGTEVQMTTEAAVNGTAPDVLKGKGVKGRIWGYLAILAAVGLAVLGGWMFYTTRGTRLLYVDVTFGRICKYYWIAFIAMLVFFAVGLYTLKRSRKEVKKDGKLE